MRVAEWTVDYGQGPRPIRVPHAWRQDMPLDWEGPAIYRATVAYEPVKGKPWLVFEGVSYEAKVRLEGFEVAVHRGIWDAFAVPLPADRSSVAVEVEVVKNGGVTFPVREVASGFLPYVYGTFGGIFRLVYVAYGANDPTMGEPAPPPAIRVDGARIYGALKQESTTKSKAEEWLAARMGEVRTSSRDVGPQQEQSLYFRGVLTWGWYPELGHCHPTLDTIEREIDQTIKLGFNLIKFCLWLPGHDYLEAMAKRGLWAWLELPLWDPAADALEASFDEMRRIVRQYRRHPNIAMWTAGCELGSTVPARFRQQLVEMIEEETGAPLIKDNSGGSEMYGGDLREYGSYADFHPYCDTPFYPQVLDSLMHGARRNVPILLGEFNDIDVHRDLDRVRVETPYWASSDPDLNAQGVRWQYDLPGLPDDSFEKGFAADSLSKAIFIRKFVQEEVRSRDIAGYVVTGWRDTPISTAGMVDDWDQPRFRPEDFAHWNGPTCLFRLPSRRPPWVHGGNRPGWVDPFNVFAGRCHFRIGVHSEFSQNANFEWDILHFSWEGSRRPQGRVAQGGAEEVSVNALEPTEIAEISWETDRPGGYLLRCRYGDTENAWPIWVLPEPEKEAWADWSVARDYDGLFSSLTSGVHEAAFKELRKSDAQITLLEDAATVPRPFWRESAYEFHDKEFWDHLSMRGHWERFLPITPDRAIDLSQLRGDWKPLLTRVDTRTYERLPVIVQDGARIATTLRPHGGLGISPWGVHRNPAGRHFLEKLRTWLLR